MCVIIVAYKGTQGRIVSSFMLSRRLTLCVAKKVQREDQMEHKLREIVRDISLETLWKCWRTYHYALLASLWGLKVMLVVPLHLRLSHKTLVTCGWRRVLMHDHYLCPCINSSTVYGHRFMHHDIHNPLVSLLSVYSMFLLQVLLCTCCFVDLPLLVVFFSVLKNSKTHKNWKMSKKFDHLCCVYHMRVWSNTFVLMA